MPLTAPGSVVLVWVNELWSCSYAHLAYHESAFKMLVGKCGEVLVYGAVVRMGVLVVQLRTPGSQLYTPGKRKLID